MCLPGQHLTVEPDIYERDRRTADIDPQSSGCVTYQADQLPGPAAGGRFVFEQLHDALVYEPPGKLADGGGADGQVPGYGGT